MKTKITINGSEWQANTFDKVVLWGGAINAVLATMGSFSGSMGVSFVLLVIAVIGVIGLVEAGRAGYVFTGIMAKTAYVLGMIQLGLICGVMVMVIIGA